MTTHDQPAVLCLAHLRWDWVWQRPQHLLSRIARHYPVLYVQEPTIGAADAALHIEPVAETGALSAWQPVFPDRPEIIAEWRATYTRSVQELLIAQGWLRQTPDGLQATRPIIAWFYTPQPVYMLDELPTSLVVYDVMDELAYFKGAAADLPQREARLLEQAQVVFCGGRSLYAARQQRHPNTHLFASGVEAAHFARAADPATPVATELAALSQPVLGYYGVLDERLDLELLAALAENYPHWSIVLVGPVTKIDQSELPRAANLHYVDQQPYERLPSFLKGFDVCLMPFALNDATRFISPTKTLEYMAAHKPIVATPVPDVVANWSNIVRIADTPDAFAAAVEHALRETQQQRADRIAREADVIAEHSWDHIADAMRAQIEAARFVRKHAS